MVVFIDVKCQKKHIPDFFKAIKIYQHQEDVFPQTTDNFLAISHGLCYFLLMLKDKDTQASMEFVAINDLMPRDHLLRKVDRAIDFSFIREEVAPLNCADNGRPAIDPELLFKMLFFG